MEDLYISSAQNGRVKAVVKLRNRRERDKQGLYIVEGYRALSRGLNYGIKLKELYFCPKYFLGENEKDLINRHRQNGAQIVEVTDSVFDKMAYRDRPEGLLGIAPQFHLGLDDLELSENPFLLIGEAIEKPGNLGTMLRSADATGTEALIVCDRCTDIFNPNVVRASTGCLFSVPTFEAGSDEVIGWLKEKGIKILAATPHTDNMYTDVDMTGPIAIAVGTEQYGLSDKWMEQADLKVKIPMLGQADSLNVATATTILMYEVIRQRSISEKK
jgi:TrmH family RNA methyltransferase